MYISMKYQHYVDIHHQTCQPLLFWSNHYSFSLQKSCFCASDYSIHFKSAMLKQRHSSFSGEILQNIPLLHFEMLAGLHHHRVYELVGISNFMLFVNKQTNKHLMPPQMQESSVYMHVVLVFH